MIAVLRGRLVKKQPTHIVLDVHGVGYSVSIPVSCFQTLGEIGSEVELLTHLHVRENVLQLYGFPSEEERELFETLLSVSGIGPRTALGILSGTTVDSFRAAVGDGDWESLTALPGVGKKTAQRLVVELKEKVGLLESKGAVIAPALKGTGSREATAALVELGVSPPQARKAVEKVVQNSRSDLPVAEIIRQALRHPAQGANEKD